MNQIIDVLAPYLNQKELHLVYEILKNSITLRRVRNRFSRNRAKDIAEILFSEKSRLRDNEKALELYIACEKYYKQSKSLNLIFGEGALEPSGMCNLKEDVSPYVYESLY